MRAGRGTLALVWLAALACAGPAQQRYEEELEAAPAPAAHRVHGERLTDLMRGMERLRGQRLPQALDVEVELEARAAQVAEVALALADSARRIGEAPGEAALAGDERREFLARADTLRERSEALARLARKRPVVDLEPAIASLELACDACHQRFRAGGPSDGR